MLTINGQQTKVEKSITFRHLDSYGKLQSLDTKQRIEIRNEKDVHIYENGVLVFYSISRLENYTYCNQTQVH